VYDLAEAKMKLSRWCDVWSMLDGVSLAQKKTLTRPCLGKIQGPIPLLSSELHN
jgi:hypothetical protein